MPRFNSEELTREMNRRNNEPYSIQLQGVGRVPAIFVSEMEVGDRVVFNYGYVYRVTSIARISDKFVKVLMKAERDGNEWGQRMKLDRLVVVLDGESHNFKVIRRGD